MRLIDADALKAKWYDINDIDENDRGARFVGYTEIARLIDQAPTVSAEAVHKPDYSYEADMVRRLKESLSAENSNAKTQNSNQETQNSNGEIIKWLESLKAEIGKSEHRTLWHYAEAIDMAIEALSAPSGDLISRADAIKAVAEHFSFDDGCSNIYKDIEYYKGIAEHILKNVPSADADVVRCKDCKHLKTMCEDEGTCYYWCKHWNNATDDWGHCYYGERREP